MWFAGQHGFERLDARPQAVERADARFRHAHHPSSAANLACSIGGIPKTLASSMPNLDIFPPPLSIRCLLLTYNRICRPSFGVTGTGS